MASLPRSEVQNHDTTMRDLKWSPAEKAIARKAFERALQQDLEAVIREAKKMAEEIEEPSDLWELERYLTQRRKQIDRQYDYRYSVLPVVFASLIRKGRLREEELYGLSEDKLGHIRQMAKLSVHPNSEGWPSIRVKARSRAKISWAVPKHRLLCQRG